MGQENDTKKNFNRAQDQEFYDGKLWSMLNDAYCIGAEAMTNARNLVESGQSKGVLGWTAIAERAIGEIIRLSPMAGVENQEYSNTYNIRFLEPENQEQVDA